MFFGSEKHGDMWPKQAPREAQAKKDAIQFSDDRCRELAVWSCWFGTGWMFFGNEKHCKRWTNAEV